MSEKVDRMKIISDRKKKREKITKMMLNILTTKKEMIIM